MLTAVTNQWHFLKLCSPCSRTSSTVAIFDAAPCYTLVSGVTAVALAAAGAERIRGVPAAKTYAAHQLPPLGQPLALVMGMLHQIHAAQDCVMAVAESAASCAAACSGQ